MGRKRTTRRRHRKPVSFPKYSLPLPLYSCMVPAHAPKRPINPNVTHLTCWRPEGYLHARPFSSPISKSKPTATLAAPTSPRSLRPLDATESKVTQLPSGLISLPFLPLAMHPMNFLDPGPRYSLPAPNAKSFTCPVCLLERSNWRTILDNDIVDACCYCGENALIEEQMKWCLKGGHEVGRMHFIDMHGAEHKHCNACRAC
jgi:hypothetical protein